MVELGAAFEPRRKRGRVANRLQQFEAGTIADDELPSDTLRVVDERAPVEPITERGPGRHLRRDALTRDAYVMEVETVSQRHSA